MKSRNGFRIAAITLILSGIMILPAQSDDRKIMRLGIEQAKAEAVLNSNTLRHLVADRNDLMDQYLDVSDQVKQLDTLHQLLPRYRYLYEKNRQTQGNATYASYFSLSQQRLALSMELSGLSQPADAARILEITNQIAAIDASIDLLGLTQEAISSIITPQEALELQAYASQFALVGMTSPNLSGMEEYKLFAEPAQVAPYKIMTGIRKLDAAVDLAKGSITLGMDQLYRTVPYLQSMKRLAVRNLEVVNKEKSASIMKVINGLATEQDYYKAANSAASAALKLNQLNRQMDTLMMNCRYLLALDSEDELQLTDTKGKLPETQEMKMYLEAALSNRNEIKTLVLSIDEMKYELDIMDDYIKGSDLYKSAELELAARMNDLEQTKLNIQQEITAGYASVLLKRETYLLCDRALAQAVREYGEVSSYAARGFVSENTLLKASLLMIQQEADSMAAYHDYAHALVALEAASQAGPAYHVP